MTAASLPRSILQLAKISHLSSCMYTRSTLRRKRGFSTGTSLVYVDPALEWGRQNTKLAQACLEIPPLSMDVANTWTDGHHPLTSFPAYWKWRRWKFPVVDEQDLPRGQALVSHVLSAPLTLATFVTVLLEQHPSPPASLRLCCVGARSEAVLPLDFWKEFLLAMTTRESHQQPTPPLSVTMDFLGPDIVPAQATTLPPPQSLSHDNARLDLQWLYKGYLHDHLAANNSTCASTDWDAFVLFNPGLGHAHLKEGWKPTLDYLWQQHSEHKTPLLLTAHSEWDAQRDWNLLCQDFGNTLPKERQPQKNPFASHITYQDPLDADHRVQPNHSVVMLL